jgi:hypothetical protein
MDPYLEHPALWPDVHHGMIAGIQRVLTAQLRPAYYVRVEERIYVSNEDDPGRSVIVPDLRIEPTGRPRPMPAQGAVATLDVAQAIEMTLLDDEIHEARLQIIDRQRRLVVTIIEVVSPTNKVFGSSGRKDYEQKRAEVNASPTNMVEIDLLRGGTPLYAKETLPLHEYLVHVGKWNPDGRRHFFWPIRLAQRLPVIAIPLRTDDPDAPLDLQEVLTAAYDDAGYDLNIDYSQDPVPPLSEELAQWAKQHLRNLKATPQP